MTVGGFGRPAGFLAAAVVASLLYLVLPAGGLGEAWTFALMNSAAAIALWWRVVRGELRGKLWLLLASAQSVYVLTTIAWYPYAIASQTVWGFPSAVDYLWWAAFLGWGTFLVGINWRRDAQDRGVAWEAIAAAVGLSVVTWRCLVEPAIDAVGLTTAARIASFVYPVLLLMLATLAVRASLLRNRMRQIDLLCVSWRRPAAAAGGSPHPAATGGDSHLLGRGPGPRGGLLPRGQQLREEAGRLRGVRRSRQGPGAVLGAPQQDPLSGLVNRRG